MLKGLYENPSAMTPLFPESEGSALHELSLEFIKASSRLSGVLNAEAREAMALLIEPMNSYYSNLIEGHFTHPLEIEKAIHNDYSKNPAKRLLQLEGKAHVHVNKLLKKKVLEMDVVSKDFICWLHKEFYNQLPEELRLVKSENGEEHRVVPGEFRTREVEVGKHVAPMAERLDSFLNLFVENYNPKRIQDPLRRVTAIAASHHRLAWIHPFLDGNGRMLRLFSEAYFISENLHADGLWSISRGLAVYKNEYYAALHNADQTRFNDYDGRGNLSDKTLGAFCHFFLKTALDQVNFMMELFEVDKLVKRIDAYVDLMVTRDELRTESRYVIIEALLRGKINKKEMERITGRSEVIARQIMRVLLSLEILVTETDHIRSPLRINFPVRVAPYFFPRLFPKDIEATIE